ncbi:hypothetical protein SARC_10644 [Sphaeroforma arctica JP610]|uniref:Uncharacterized protein n=1 Tax=Sphaeroforma arctica JP610 TaxID=667725 RepID=A0A0L0FLI0_9EUKA|nr:hypothetical protein SARC_10644 [Sphaeroforma arctica JP610]KNC76883.1 hypothetical protein SARC_10644 [Sphaeroforma arctica JP610]|eukprot:XP_014150785.1 hypothetical protein SARC_10644 [Sphaeroforma arctica JP610]
MSILCLHICIVSVLLISGGHAVQLHSSELESSSSILHPSANVRWSGAPFRNRTGMGPGRWLKGFLDTPLDHDDTHCAHQAMQRTQSTQDHVEKLVQDSSNKLCPTVSLPIVARLADVQPAPLGPMLLHCGGPSSGKECINIFINGTTEFYGAPRMDSRLLASYDIIGIDQRGVQDSRPSVNSIVCFPSNLSDTEQVLAAISNRTAVQKEVYNDPKYHYPNGKNFLDYTSTRDFAFDLDLLRQSIGAKQLSIMGFSYGTLVGATYATLFPAHAGRILCLGPVLSTVDASAFSEGTAQAYEGVLTRVLRLCDKQQGCPAGPDSQKMLIDVLDNVKRGVYSSSDGKTLMETVFYNYVKEHIRYSVAYYHLLSVVAGISKHDQATIDEVVAYRPVDNRGLWCDVGEVGAVSNIHGSDYTSRLGPPEMLGEIERRARLYPLGGQFEALWYQLALSGSQSMPRPVRLGDPDIPVLVVGNLYDSATSYKWSASLSNAFPNGQLITFQGDGHCMAEAAVGYAREDASQCQAVLNQFLLEGSIDPSITLCPVHAEPNTTAEYVPWTWEDVDSYSTRKL